MASFQGLVLALIVSLHGNVQGQLSTEQRTCCASNLMDSGGKVVVDMQHGINTAGTFVAMKVLVCTTTETYIQFWQPTVVGNFTNMALMWQMGYKATSFGGFVFNLDPPLQVGADWKIGFFSPDADTHSVPYEYSKLVFRSQISQQYYPPGHSFSPGDQIQLDDLRWPRSMAVNVFLCRQRDCPDQSLVSLSPLLVAGPKGEPGTPGTPGTPGSPGQSCSPNFGMTPDAIRDVNDQVSGIKSDTQKLFDLVERMSNQVTELTKGNLVTGTCPVGFIPGNYGIGNCYYISRFRKVSMLEAQISCRVDYDAHLVNIVTELEDVFLRNQITSMIQQTGDGNMEDFWTSGMYSTSERQWVWYYENIYVKRRLQYDNFRSEAARSNANGFSQCLYLTVDSTNNRSWWNSGRCEFPKYFICQTAKNCL